MAQKQRIFTVHQTISGSLARRGTLELPHGPVETPAFMPVGTNATVKALYHRTVSDMGYRLILGNTYHLYLRPGIEVIKSFGGLHRFSSWDGNILTDSGGFQVFSLSRLRKVTEAGVSFQSHIDGSRHFLTPEAVVDLQCAFGSDIMMCLDVCTPYGYTYRKASEALRITTDWAKRSKEQWKTYEGESNGLLFGIVQGNFYKDLRSQSIEEIGELDFPGIALGGLSVGEPREIYSEYLAYAARQLPEEKPRYVMGIGTPEYIFEAVSQGIDLFDCVFATRTARNGALFTRHGMIQIKKARWEYDQGPVDDACTCTACTRYSRGYLRHLFKCGEILGAVLASEHNLLFLRNLMEAIHRHIESGTYERFKGAFLDAYTRGED